MFGRQQITLWQSVHTHYIGFARDSLQAATPRGRSLDPVRLDRATVDVILYSHAAIEASTETLWQHALTGQLAIRPSDTWALRFARRKWNDMSLADRLGFLAFSLRGEGFWKNPQQQQLFNDLRKLRDALTHARPVGLAMRQSKMLRSAYGVLPLQADRLVSPGKSIAEFAATPDALGKEDAEQVFEIMLRHLARLEEVCGIGASLSIFDAASVNILGPTELLATIATRFDAAWSGAAEPEGGDRELGKEE